MGTGYNKAKSITSPVIEALSEVDYKGLLGLRPNERSDIGESNIVHDINIPSQRITNITKSEQVAEIEKIAQAKFLASKQPIAEVCLPQI